MRPTDSTNLSVSRLRPGPRFLVVALCCIGALDLLQGGTAEGWRKKRDATGVVVAVNPLNHHTVFAAAGGFGGPRLTVSYDRGETWTQQFDPGLSSIGQILIHPVDTLTIFCAGSPDLRKSTDGGITWRTVLNGYAIDGESIVIDPQHPDTMYAGETTEGWVYRSTDRGEQWPDRWLSVNNVSTLSIRPDNPGILYAGTGLGSISKSTDRGKTWRIVKHSVNPGAVKTEKIAISSTSPLIAYAAFNGNVDTATGVWKTTNGGELWTRTNSPVRSFQGMAVDPASPDIVFAGTADDLPVSVYRSTDGGLSWEAQTIGLPQRGSVLMMAMHPTVNTTSWAAVTDAVSGTGGVHRFGTTSTIIRGAVLNGSNADTVRNGYLVTSPVRDSIDLSQTGGSFAFYYFDGDPSETLSTITRAYPYYDASASFGFLQDQEKSEDLHLQELATRSIGGTVVDSLTGEPRRAQLMLRGTSSLGTFVLTDSSDTNGRFSFDGLYISYPQINHYDEIRVLPDLPYARQRLVPVSLDTNGLDYTIPLSNADLLVVSATDSGQFVQYYSTALESIHVGYNIWDEVSRGTAPMSVASGLRKKIVIYYTGSHHGPLPGGDADSLVAALNAGCSLFLTGQDIAEKNDTTTLLRDYLRTGFQASTLIAYVTGTPGDIFNSLGFNTVNFGASNQTSRDILKPLDTGAKTVIGYGYGNLGIAAVRLDSVGSGGRAVFLGFGFEAVSGADVRLEVMDRAIRYLDGTTVVGVNDGSIQDLLPGETALEQNFPNPFNPRTEIVYLLSDAAEIELAVFDVTGRRVAVLEQGRRSAGKHSAVWNAGGFSSGVYVCRMIASSPDGSFTRRVLTRLMLLVK